jgi:DNA-binding NarL/FixJ family response regulator
MGQKPMKILIIEDDVKDCEAFIKSSEQRDDIEIVAITDSDIEGLKYVKTKYPEGIVLDLELNNSLSGSTDSLEFLNNLKKLKLNYEPIIIVTTHVNSKRTYEILHRNGVDLILYKEHPKYSVDHVLNNFINLRRATLNVDSRTMNDMLKTKEEQMLKMIESELDLIGISNKMKGRDYIEDAIMYLIKHDDDETSVIEFLMKKYKKSKTTITNGIQNAIIHAWRISAIEDLERYYTARINYQTGVPTPMEFLSYYVNKIKKEI